MGNFKELVHIFVLLFVLVCIFLENGYNSLNVLHICYLSVEQLLIYFILWHGFYVVFLCMIFLIEFFFLVLWIELRALSLVPCPSQKFLFNIVQLQYSGVMQMLSLFQDHENFLLFFQLTHSYSFKYLMQVFQQHAITFLCKVRKKIDFIFPHCESVIYALFIEKTLLPSMK